MQLRRILNCSLLCKTLLADLNVVVSLVKRIQHEKVPKILSYLTSLCVGNFEMLSTVSDLYIIQNS